MTRQFPLDPTNPNDQHFTNEGYFDRFLVGPPDLTSLRSNDSTANEGLHKDDTEEQFAQIAVGYDCILYLVKEKDAAGTPVFRLRSHDSSGNELTGCMGQFVDYQAAIAAIPVCVETLRLVCGPWIYRDTALYEKVNQG